MSRVLLRFSRRLLPLPARDLRRLTAVRIPGDRGIGALLGAALARDVVARQFGPR